MDLKKEVFLSNKIYYGKLTPQDWGGYDVSLFAKYGEPSVNVGGDFSDGVTEFSLANSNKLVKTEFPYTQFFETLNIGYEEAGKRAKLYVNIMEDKFKEVLGTLRSLDSTANQEILSIKVV